MRQILLLGAPRVEANAAPVEIERRKALALLAYLAVTRTTHTREALTAFFFPDVDEARGLAYLRTGLWTLNKALGDDWVLLDGDTVRFNTAANIFIDVHQLESAASAARTALTTPQGHRERVALLTEAAGLYRGDFMAGFLLRDTQPFEDWQLVHTEQVRRTFANILECLVESHIALGDFEPAKTYALRWLILDAMNETAVRQVMRLHAWTGQHSAALRLYRDTVALLKRELDIEIDHETTALSAAIQERRIPPPVLAKADAAHRQTSTGEHPVVVDLPAQATPFVGRVEELAEIERLLDDPLCRLLTLFGSGGIGKTRLAIQTAQRALHGSSYRDGVVFVPLAPVTHEDFFLYTIAEALHLIVSTQREMDLSALVMRHLQDQHLLLVLDNFEHLLSCAVILSEILTHAPNVKILVTSRERLDLREEWLFEIKGLDHSTDAQQLFLQSARRVRPDFALKRDDQQAIERIIQLVEGMPLAIELAAVWVQMLSCQEIAQEIQKGVDFLTTNARNVPERHRSLRAVFESSWQRLNDQEQQCLSRLSVLHTFRAETAQVVAGASLPLLLTLMGKSLLHRTDSGRFELHELLRQYAGSKLTSSDALQTVDRYAAYFAEFLASRETTLKTSRMPDALHELQAEIDNIRNAWLYYIYRKDVQRLAQMIDPLMIIYGVRQTHQEAVEMIQKALDALKTNSEDHSERLLVGRLLAAQAWSYMMSGRNTPARASHEQAVQMLHEFKERPEIATALLLAAEAMIVPGGPSGDTENLLREALTIYEAQQDRCGIALAHYLLGRAAHNWIRYEEAADYFHTSLAMFREIDHPLWIISVLYMLGQSAWTAGDYRQAAAWIQQALPHAERIDYPPLTLNVQRTRLYYQMSDVGVQIRELQADLETYTKLKDTPAIAWTLYELGTIHLFDENFVEAEVLHRRAIPIFHELDLKTGSAWSLIFLAMAVLGQRRFNEVKPLIDQSFAEMEQMEFPWGISGAYYVLGDLALMQGQLAEAQAHYSQAVAIAYNAHSVLQTLRHLAGFADLWFERGEYRQAAILTKMILEHQATWRDTQLRLGRLMDKLADYFSVEQLAQLSTWTLEQAVQQSIGEQGR